MNSSLSNLSSLLTANKLSLNIARTEFMVIGFHQHLATFDSDDLCITVSSEPVRQVNSTKTLELTLDENLTWKNHIHCVQELHANRFFCNFISIFKPMFWKFSSWYCHIRICVHAKVYAN